MFSDILIPALFIGGLGLIFGALLGYASIKFKVDKNENIDKVAELLPGANCGGCGFTGCSALAEAIVENGEKITRCNLVNEKQVSEISKVLGIRAEKVVKKKAVVRCSGCAEKAVDKYNPEGLNDCREAFNLGGGPKMCDYGCMGLGSCVKACKFGAISIEKGIAVVDREKCTGCGACAEECPKNVISLEVEEQKTAVLCKSADKGAQVKIYCSAGCIGCKMCEKNCPHGAVTVINNLASINSDLCINCGACVKVCPKKVISYNI